MTRHLTEVMKTRIIVMLEEGWSIRMVAERFNINKSTVFKIKKRWEEEQTVKRKVGSGRKSVSNADDDIALLNHLRENPFASAMHAVADSNFPGSRSTACRRIKKSDIKNHAAARKPSITLQTKQTRLLFALNYVYREEFWQNVVFSDEKIFQSRNNGHIRVYRPRNSRFDEAYVHSIQSSGRFSVNVWAWISFRGMGVCWKIDGSFRKESYENILENVMLPSVTHLYPENNFIFQHDNCPVHTANNITQWFRNNNVETLPWPAYSPDLNPIENVWGYIVKKIYQKHFHPQNANELWEFIENGWEDMCNKENFIHNYINSMPSRLREVITRDGAMTKY